MKVISANETNALISAYYPVEPVLQALKELEPYQSLLVFTEEYTGHTPLSVYVRYHSSGHNHRLSGLQFITRKVQDGWVITRIAAEDKQ